MIVDEVIPYHVFVDKLFKKENKLINKSMKIHSRFHQLKLCYHNIAPLAKASAVKF